MSTGPKKKEDEIVGPNVVTLDQAEFNRVCKRVHAMLLNRAEKAREKKDKKPTKSSSTKHIEASKDVFVFVHLLELLEAQTEEISDLREIVSTISSEDDMESVVGGVIGMMSGNKKKYLN